ncbi:MAG: hypothetical protein JHC34_02365 [Acidobacteria bacterium]|nr:hypothetical protein [Acidobacteriota bacterium]
MNRRRFIQAILTVLLALFLLLLVIKFRPRTVSVKPLERPAMAVESGGSLAASGFKYVEERSGTVAFVVTADKVTERPGEAKLLFNARVSFPSPGGESVALGKQGLFDAQSHTLRLWDQAKIIRPDGWAATSPGFRLTPEGEIISEEAADLRRGSVEGRADLLRYQRDSQKAYLEGKVHFKDGAGREFSCQRLIADMVTHLGQITGPVTITGPEGTVKAPGGSLVFAGDNTIKAVTLEPAVRGEGPSGKMICDKLAMAMRPDGSIESLSLQGAVKLDSDASAQVVETALLSLRPKAAGGWDWESPGELAVSRKGDRLKAPSGKGTTGAGPFTASLPGPVIGDGPSGQWSCGHAAVEGPVRSLDGDVKMARAEDTLWADHVTIQESGATEARGNVRGRRETKGSAPMTFTSQKASAAPKIYPLNLQGACVVTKGAMRLEAPSVLIKNKDSVEASGGALCLWSDPKSGERDLKAPFIAYYGLDRHVLARNGAHGTGDGYTIDADEVEALLDAENRVLNYTATGEAKLASNSRDASGDKLTYNPNDGTGQAESSSGRAVLVQKNPYRRAEGALVIFGEKSMSVHQGTSAARGVLEASVPKEKRPDGR